MTRCCRDVGGRGLSRRPCRIHPKGGVRGSYSSTARPSLTHSLTAGPLCLGDCLIAPSFTDCSSSHGHALLATCVAVFSIATHFLISLLSFSIQNIGSPTPSSTALSCIPACARVWRSCRCSYSSSATVLPLVVLKILPLPTLLQGPRPVFRVETREQGGSGQLAFCWGQ